jgi:chromosomal replication initiation ATPase DnaA
MRDYQWSSYRGYAGLSQQKSFVREDLVLDAFSDGKSDHKIRAQYREFVEEGLRQNIASPFQQVRQQIALGDESFTERLSKKFKATHDRQREVTGLKRRGRRSDYTHLIKRVASHYGIPCQTITNQDVPGSEARNVAIWLLRQKGGLTLREIGQLFGGIDYAAISQRVRRLNQRIGKRKRLRATCKMLNV